MEPQRGSRLCLNSGGLECRACGMWCVGVCGRCVTVRGPTGRWKTMHLYLQTSNDAKEETKRKTVDTRQARGRGVRGSGWGLAWGLSSFTQSTPELT